MSDAKPFAEHGCEKMLYDIRSGPQTLYHEGTVYSVYQAGSEGPEGHPHIRAYYVEKDSWSNTHRIGTVSRYDHHYCPIIWFDKDNYTHVLYHCHGKAGTHIVSDEPLGIDSFSTAPDVSFSISYPRMITLSDGRLLLYYRTFGHMGFWTYRVSEDGIGWSDPTTVVDFDRDPHSNEDTWAGSYHSFAVNARGTGLHVTFIRINERENVRKVVNPLYGQHVGYSRRYNLYYLHLDIDSGTVTNIDGEQLETPVTRSIGESCKVYDSGHRLGNQPGVIDDGEGEPLMMYPGTSRESPWEGAHQFIRRVDGQWKWTPVSSLNNTWDGNWLIREEDGLSALLTTGDVDGSKLAYGGGSRVERWISLDEGTSWVKAEDLIPEDGLIYNNPRPVQTSDGGVFDGYLTMFGWEGPYSIAKDSTKSARRNDGRAYLYGEGQWL